MGDCKYSFREGDCPALSSTRDLINKHSDETGVFYMDRTGNPRVSGAVIAQDAFMQVYCRNEGKGCSVKSHLDECRKK